MMSFSNALTILKEGGKVFREGWYSVNEWIAIQGPWKTPTEASDMTEPYIYLKTQEGALVPFTATSSDLLSDDWHTLQEPGEDDPDYQVPN